MTITTPTASVVAGDQLLIVGAGSGGANVVIDHTADDSTGQLVTVGAQQFKVTVDADNTASPALAVVTFTSVADGASPAAQEATKAEFKALLDLVAFNHTSDIPVDGSTRVFTVDVLDSGDLGVQTKPTFTVTLNATNDVPTVVDSTVTISGSDYVVDKEIAVTEKADNATGENSASLTDAGVVNFSDLDFNTGTVAIALVSADLVNTSSPSTVITSGVSAKGSLAAGSIVAAASDAEKSVPLNFSVNDGDVDSLEAGTSIKQVYSVTYSDGTATAVQNVTVMVNGSADGPTVDLKTADNGTVNLAATFTESDAVDAGGVNKVMFTDSGTSLADVDAGAKLDKLSISILDANVEASDEIRIVGVKSGGDLVVNLQNTSLSDTFDLNGITFTVATADAQTNSAGDTHLTTITTSSPIDIADMEAVLDKIAYNNASAAPNASLTKYFL